MVHGMDACAAAFARLAANVPQNWEAVNEGAAFRRDADMLRQAWGNVRHLAEGMLATGQVTVERVENASPWVLDSFCQATAAIQALVMAAVLLPLLEWMGDGLVQEQEQGGWGQWWEAAQLVRQLLQSSTDPGARAAAGSDHRVVGPRRCRTLGLGNLAKFILKSPASIAIFSANIPDRTRFAFPCRALHFSGLVGHAG